MDLERRAGQAMTRSDLAEFLEQLADSSVTEPERWDHSNLADFLRSWSAWLGDMDGFYAGRGEPVPAAPSWQSIAQMLLAARVYE
jgi:hypothetical protein